jgi:hypothetical protein
MTNYIQTFITNLAERENPVFIKRNVFLAGLKNNTIPIQDFIKSQQAFVTCVNYWSQILGKLLYRLSSHQDRKLILENLFEEHGFEAGHYSHVETFTKFMESIGGQVTHTPDQAAQSFNDTLDRTLDEPDLAVCIAALGYVEYYYQQISTVIVEYLKQNDKYTNIHYAEHELLDVKHYTDLFSLLSKYDDEHAISALARGRQIVIGLFDAYYRDSYLQNCLPSPQIAKFGYHWEDPSVEDKAIQHMQSTTGKQVKNLLLISSGGEMLFHLLAKFGDTLDSITCLDFNSAQIELIKRKFADISAGRLDEYYGSVFEDLFYQSFQDGKWDEHFSLDNLTRHFTETAVKYIGDAEYNTFESYCRHFRERCESMDKSSYFYELLKNKKYNPDNRPEFFGLFDVVKRNWHKVSFVVGDIITHLDSLPSISIYDFISVSNVTDWLSLDECNALGLQLSWSVSDNGYVVMRRIFKYFRGRSMACNGFLLDISNLFNEDPVQWDIKDSTNFYAETLVLTKTHS